MLLLGKYVRYACCGVKLLVNSLAFDILTKLRNREIAFPPLTIKAFTEEEFKHAAITGDGFLRVQFEELSFKFLVEIKSSTTPRVVLSAASKIERYSKLVNAYPMLIVPWLSQENLAALEKMSVSAIDLCGNGIVTIPGRVLILRTGAPNLYKEERTIKNVYRGESAMIARTFLVIPAFRSLSTLHEHVNLLNGKITLATVSKVVSSLEDDLIVVKDKRQIFLHQPEKLLQALVDQYEPPTVLARVKGSTEISADAFWEKLDIMGRINLSQVCQTGASSAPAYAAMAEGPTRSYYVDVPISKLLQLVNVRFRETDRFPHTEIIQVKEQWPFFDKRIIGPFHSCSSPIQSFLEMVKGDKRQQQIASQIQALILREVGVDNFGPVS